MRLYTIESQTRYAISLQRIENIEDATDVVYTIEELKEMFGDDPQCYYDVWIRRPNIEADLADLKSRIPDGKKSIIINNADLLEFFKEHPNWSVSDFVKGLRRVGNRLFIHEKAEKQTANKKDVSWLINVGGSAIRDLYNIDVEFKYCYKNWSGNVNVIKKLITWDQVVSHLEKITSNKGQIEQFKKFGKIVWDDPAVFDNKE